MEFFVLKSEAETKLIMVLVFWGIRWLYSHLNGSNDVVSNEEPDQDEIEDQPGIKEYPPITTIPITRKMTDKTPQAAPLFQSVTAKPNSSQPASSSITECKTSFSRKQKLFRNGLLMHAFIQRKYF
ncbi:hypothetical protein [Cardinium endosymbiont of Philonthus spinipes]|uniref:hypothetical protein n=1 Tax=Cardinium endosymbiont of Philonthus spinipes TaxID=3077941 RepID=UPI00313B7664